MHLKNETARAAFLDRHHLIRPPAAQGAADLVTRLGFVQVDSIATVERAHHMILWSRDATYRPARLRPPLERHRTLWEHWTHDASILPSGLYPYWKARFKRDEARLHANWKSWFRDGYEAQFGTILERIARDGPVSSSDVGEGEARGTGGWWDWHPSKTALEWLWRTGKIAVTRREGFRKLYDLTERVIPAPLLAAHPSEDAVTDWACRSALLQLGFASTPEIAAYWGAISSVQAGDWIKAALARGEVTALTYDDHRGAAVRAWCLTADCPALQAPPAPGKRLRILSPFDPALRDRKRTERLFGYHYRIEIFTPAPQRKYGYYVFPLLEGTQLIGRIDCKATRTDGRLDVTGLWLEGGQRLTRAREAALGAELTRLARLAGVEQVVMTEGWLKTG